MAVLEQSAAADVATLADWLSKNPVPMREQKAWIYEQALQSILQLSGCSLAKALAAAALADDRDHQLRLERLPGQEVSAR